MKLSALNESLETKYGIAEAFNEACEEADEKCEDQIEEACDESVEDGLDEGIFDRLKARANNVASKMNNRAAQKAANRGDLGSMQRGMENRANRDFKASANRANDAASRMSNPDDAAAHRANARADAQMQKDQDIVNAGKAVNDRIAAYLENAKKRMALCQSEAQINQVALAYWDNIKEANHGDISMLQDFRVGLTKAKKDALTNLANRGAQNAPDDIDPDFN